MNCPCDSGKTFSSCCEPLLKGERSAQSPEELMRSRYSAFAVRNLDYVANTTDPQASFDREATAAWMNGSRFTKLEVLRATNEGNKGTVEFKAHFEPEGGEAQIHHEVSKFRKQAGVWYFRDGRVLET